MERRPQVLRHARSTKPRPALAFFLAGLGLDDGAAATMHRFDVRKRCIAVITVDTTKKKRVLVLMLSLMVDGAAAVRARIRRWNRGQERQLVGRDSTVHGVVAVSQMTATRAPRLAFPNGMVIALAVWLAFPAWCRPVLPAGAARLAS